MELKELENQKQQKSKEAMVSKPTCFLICKIKKVS